MIRAFIILGIVAPWSIDFVTARFDSVHETAEEEDASETSITKQEAAQRMIEALQAVASGDAQNVDHGLEDELSSLFGQYHNANYKDVTMDDKGDHRMFQDRASSFYADRYVANMLDIVNDPDCRTNILDASSVDFDEGQVVKVLTKCGVAHVRNAIPRHILEPYKRNVTSYMMGLENGRVASDGQTTLGERYFIHETSRHRYDVSFPKELLNEDIMAPDLILDVVSDHRVIGDKVVMRDFGAIVSEPGSKLQHWHGDGHIYGGMFETHGLAGNDLPPFSVGVMIPLLNTTIQHGPTEFCMGRNAIEGIYSDEEETPEFHDNDLREAYLDAQSYFNENNCPPSFLRTPLPQFGDALFFYFNVEHRGGENRSPDVRTVLYQTYVQPWYTDDNFDEDPVHDIGSTPELQKMFGRVRAAVPDYEQPEDPSVTYGLDDLEKMGKFEPQGGHKATERSKSEREEITVSNVDVELDNVTLCVIHETDPTECTEAPKPNEGILVRAYHGEELRVYHDDALLKTWTIQGNEQLFISYAYFDNCLWEDKCGSGAKA